MKRGTHAGVFTQTLAHTNNKNEISERKDEDGKKRGVSVEISNERSPNGLCLPNQNTIMINTIIINIILTKWT